MIDNIENNINSTVNYVEQAKEETKQAVVYQKKARRVRNMKIFSNFNQQPLTRLTFRINFNFVFDCILF
jgi:hypothetical protein